MARSVADAALLFKVMAEHGVDKRPTRESLEGFRLKGLRIGVLTPPPSANAEAVKRWQEWHAPLAAEGAVLIEVEASKTLAQIADAESAVLLWEFKAAINDYLLRLPGRIEVRTLADLIAFNRAHAAKEMPIFGQDLFEDADKLGDLATPAYRQARDHLMNLADNAGLAKLFARYQVDVLLAMADGPAELIDSVWGDRPYDGSWPPIASAAAVAGYPSLTVPAGLVRELPVGVIFVAPRHHDGTLLHIGHAYERATHARRPPSYVAG